MKPLLFNPTDGKYSVTFSYGRVIITDSEGNELDSDTALHIASTLLDQYDEECYVYVGYSDKHNWVKVGMSGNPDRRDKELKIQRMFDKRCIGKKEAQRLEKSVLDFMTNLGRLVYQNEWFEYHSHDLALIKTIFTQANGLYAAELFNAMTKRYTRAKSGISNNKNSEVLDYIYRWGIPAFRDHAKIEFGYLPKEKTFS